MIGTLILVLIVLLLALEVAPGAKSEPVQSRGGHHMQLTTDLVSIPRSETETVPAGTTSLVDCMVTRYCYVVAHQTGEDRQG